MFFTVSARDDNSKKKGKRTPANSQSQKRSSKSRKRKKGSDPSFEEVCNHEH